MKKSIRMIYLGVGWSIAALQSIDVGSSEARCCGGAMYTEAGERTEGRAEPGRGGPSQLEAPISQAFRTYRAPFARPPEAGRLSVRHHSVIPLS